MNSAALYDLSPVWQVMLLGLTLALGPLAWVAVRHRRAALPQGLRALTLLTLFLTFDLVVFGAFTRLTDSGLGCPDWPGCYGSASPVGAKAHIAAAQSALPSGPVTHSKAWIEMIHRYLATGVGVLILSLALLHWRAWWQQRQNAAAQAPALMSPWWPTLTLVWVCLQGAFGALTVTMKLFPAIVTLHLLGGMVLLALLRVQLQGYTQAESVKTLPVGLTRFAVLAFALLWLQIALGGWVSTNYAVLACNTFPTCQGSWWPAMDFQQGFSLWRELGEGTAGGSISFAALTAIHYVHRLAAYALFLVLLLLAAGLQRWPSSLSDFRHRSEIRPQRGQFLPDLPANSQAIGQKDGGKWTAAVELQPMPPKVRQAASYRQPAIYLAGLALLQALTGISNVVLGWPLLAAVLHTAGAAALVLVLTGVVCSARAASRSKSAASHTP